ncbi:MAG TPA: hypothetical protein VF143_06160 [Candidatus Nanopelagicales bacterium]
MSSPWTSRPRRPGGVTFVVLLTWVVAFLSLVRGFLALFGEPSALRVTDPATGTGATYAWTELGFGILVALVAIGLARGSSVARLLVSALMVLRVLAAIWAAFAFSGLASLLGSALLGGFAVIILLLLWNGRADAFFSR